MTREIEHEFIFSRRFCVDEYEIEIRSLVQPPGDEIVEWVLREILLHLEDEDAG